VVVYIFLRFLSLIKSELVYLVYNEPRCSQTGLDHSVIVIGYGTDSGKDYWLAKNR